MKKLPMLHPCHLCNPIPQSENLIPKSHSETHSFVLNIYWTFCEKVEKKHMKYLTYAKKDNSEVF